MLMRNHHARLEAVRCRLALHGARVSGGTSGYVVVVNRAASFRAPSLSTLEALCDRLAAMRQEVQK